VILRYKETKHPKIRKTARLIFVCLLFISFLFNSSEAFMVTDTTATRSILENRNKFNARQIISGDTLDLKKYDSDITAMPGGKDTEYSAEQDTAYFRALKNRLPLLTRLNHDLRIYSAALKYRDDLLKKSPWEIASENIRNIPPDVLKPTNIEIVQHTENIRLSQYVPGIRGPVIGGLSIPLSSIGQFFGITEDVSPVIKYQLDHASDVVIVIYSVQASVVATLFDGHQPADSYKIVWNGKDDKGRKMPSGDYIGEVRIGNYKYVRKRILIP